MEYRLSGGGFAVGSEKDLFAKHHRFEFLLRERLVESEGSTPNLAEWRRLDAVSSAAVVRLYKEKAGIEISPDWPKPYFLTRERTARIGLDPDAAATIPTYNLVVYSVFQNADPLNYARLFGPFHERFHNSGRTILTIKGKEEKLLFLRTGRVKTDLYLAQLGLATVGGSVRGEGLEEAAASYYATKLMFSTVDENTLNFRRRLFSPLFKAYENTRIDTRLLSSSDFLRIEGEFWAKHPQFVFSQRSVAGQKLFAALLERAVKRGLDHDFEELVLKTRVYPATRLVLFNLITEIVRDRNLARNLFCLNSSDIRKLNAFTTLLQGCS